jgi:MFS family permease
LQFKEIILSNTEVQRPAKVRSFAALRHPGYRAYLSGNALVMLADSVEHVISYWILYQKFHSPMLGGLAVLTHWLPFLFFAVYSGALADRFDPRRIVQLGMVLFMVASLGWSVMFLTDKLTVGRAVTLLVIHGFAGVLWGPPSQVLIHDIVPAAELQSAVRLMATSRDTGLLAGPAVGGAMLLALGPSRGLMVNAAIYLPLTLWLWRAPYGPRFRAVPAVRMPMRGFGDIVATAGMIAGNRILVSMTVMVGAASLIVGNAYQAQMPEFAQDLGHGNAGVFYSLLLAADAAGALTGGLVLESRGLLRAQPRTAILLVMGWCCALVGFAMSSAYPLALLFLFAAGFLELSFNSMAQALVQLHAPAAIRGRVIGLFNMSGLGLRAFAGLTVGFGGSLLGIHWSLALSAMALFFVTGGIALAVGAEPVAAASGD